MRRIIAVVALAAVAAWGGTARAAGVSVAEDEATFTLANDHVTAKVAKRSGDLVSLKFHGLELLGDGSGHPYAYWSHTPGRGQKSVARVTIDPKTNGGERAEVSVSASCDGKPLGNGPGGSTICDVEI